MSGLGRIGPNDHTIAQIKDAVGDGLRAVQNTLEDESVVSPSPCICKEVVSGFESMTNRSPRLNFTVAPGLALTLLQ
ncbi:T-complex protein 1 subunit zeta 1 [Spatholobus suberectus]|nr:T-complex protein 1 subunit zeta 1 [Spatholobus suberectus]